MIRENRASRERRSTKIAEPLEQDDTEGSISAQAVENDSYAKRGSTPLQKQWTSSEDSSRPYSREIKTSFLRGQGNTEDTEIESPDIERSDKPRRSEERPRGKTRYSDGRTSEERVTSKSLGGRRRKHSKRIERSRTIGKQPRTVDRDHHDRFNTESSTRRYSEEDSVADKSRRKRNVSQVGRQVHIGAEDEVPITEILKKAQENARTKYEEPVPLPELTTDTIYIQGRNGFSAVKIGGLRRALWSDTIRAAKDGIRDTEDRDFAETRTHMLIRVAITAQKFWKCTGLIYQGLLGGIALLHFVMVHVFFKISMDFILNYSIFSEIYTNIFSFLIALCLVSIFDKFDLARFDMDHLREIYTDHAKTAIAVLLYLITFGLHQASSKFDDQLALMHYRNINETIWSNDTVLEIFLEELRGWQQITMSKDLLAIFAWFFVSLGTRDNMLLMHLESMEKYASNVEPPR